MPGPLSRRGHFCCAYTRRKADSRCHRRGYKSGIAHRHGEPGRDTCRCPREPIDLSPPFSAPSERHRKPARLSAACEEFRASAGTLLQVARDPKRLGAEIGFFSVLHTWNQKLQHHPHVHCVIPAGGLAPVHSRWIDSQQKFFLPVAVLKEVFRGKFVDGLRTLHAEHKLGFHGTLAVLQNPQTFAAWVRPLFRSPWVVYSKRPFGGAQHALRYLGQYTHRVAISNHRLVSLSPTARSLAAGAIPLTKTRRV